jgi:hypothetical protein
MVHAFYMAKKPHRFQILESCPSQRGTQFLWQFIVSYILAFKVFVIKKLSQSNLFKHSL